MWNRWCERNGPMGNPDGDDGNYLVYPERTRLFLVQCIIPMGNTKSNWIREEEDAAEEEGPAKKKKKTTRKGKEPVYQVPDYPFPNEANGFVYTYRNRQYRSYGSDGFVATGERNLNSYVNALKWLQDEQKRLKFFGDNENPANPRDLVKPLMSQLIRSQESFRRSQYRDKGIGTHLDSYSTLEHRSLYAHWRNFNSMLGLRNLAMFALQHSLMQRGQFVRMLQLSDMWFDEAEDEGFSECALMGCTTRQSKTNQCGKTIVLGAIRHIDVELCTVSAVAFYFFWRWHIDGEKEIDFEENCRWYDMFFIKVCITPRA